MTRNKKRTSNPRIRFGCCTDVGCVREHNEDSLIAIPPLFVVADGMGGHAAGEVASEIAVQTMRELAPAHAQADKLAAAVTEANSAILKAVEDGIGREGMGTTLTAALLEGERLIIAQVGDSRAYLLHKGRLQQVTRDHSLMYELIEAGQLTPEEARYHPQRSVITRALGSAPDVVADIYELNVESGDRLLICSDGLTSMIEDSTIQRILIREREADACASQLVKEACAAGGHDNVTVIVADVAGFAENRTHASRKRAKITALLIGCLLMGVVAGAFVGINTWVNNSAYLADNNGTVSIYRGVSGSLFGKSSNELEATSNVETDKLNAGLSARLKGEGVAVESVESAEQLLKGYAEELNMSELKITQVK